MLYEGDDGFLRATLGFVREGVALGHPVMVAVPAERLALLADALGPDAERVELVDMTRMGHNPARIIPAWRAFVEAHRDHGGPLRGVGEPVWAGRRAAELAECQLHEALLNVAVGPDEPLWLRCPYDVAALAPEVLELAGHSHPALVQDGAHRGSTAYEGFAHVQEIFGGALPEPPGDHEMTPFTPDDLQGVRRRVSEHAARHGVGGDRAADLELAVTELATNSLRHAGGEGLLRTWRDGDALVVEVTDRGRIVDPLVGRRPPGPDDEGGRGVWMANQLCDLVQVRSSGEGTVVRALMWLERAAA